MVAQIFDTLAARLTGRNVVRGGRKSALMPLARRRASRHTDDQDKESSSPLASVAHSARRWKNRRRPRQCGRSNRRPSPRRWHPPTRPAPAPELQERRKSDLYYDTKSSIFSALIEQSTSASSPSSISRRRAKRFATSSVTSSGRGGGDVDLRAGRTARQHVTTSARRSATSAPPRLHRP